MKEIVFKNIVRFHDGNFSTEDDAVVSECPVNIYVNGVKKYFCMRMPGQDEYLAAGIMFCDGLISSAGDIVSMTYSGEDFYIEIKGDPVPGELRQILSSSGSIASTDISSIRIKNEGTIDSRSLFDMSDAFLNRQSFFERTGGTHAAALYGKDFQEIAFAEDTGRHNALDKCIGMALINETIREVFAVMLSSRISFEMVKKSIFTDAVLIAGMSAPTSFAVDSATASGVCLVGFLRKNRFNIYSNPDRISDFKL